VGVGDWPVRVREHAERRSERQLPDWVGFVREKVPPEAITLYELVASVAVAYAIEQCIPIMMSERLVDAVDKAEREG
jgi:uncharacterized protein YbaR (Trm112 family)